MSVADEIKETVVVTHLPSGTRVKVTLKYKGLTVNWTLTSYVGHITETLTDCRLIAYKRLAEANNAMAVA
jgi:hypothetical protein